MTLEDFEKALTETSRAEEGKKAERDHERSKEHQRHHHSHHESRHRVEEDGHRHKRRRRSREADEHNSEHRSHRHRHGRNTSERDTQPEGEEEWIEKDGQGAVATDEAMLSAPAQTELKRDSWMQAPSGLDVDFVQRRPREASKSGTFVSAKEDFEQKIHESELDKHHLQNTAEPNEREVGSLQEAAQHEVDYTFGDEGAQWRMMKLKAVYRQAKESGQSAKEAALDKYGDLRSFDDAREEEIELERRETYGDGYVGKQKPSGELFQGRKLEAGLRREKSFMVAEEDDSPPRIQTIVTTEPPTRTTRLDQTGMNKLKAQAMKAKLRGSADAVTLEAEYNTAMAGFSNNKEPEVVILGTMDNRMLAGGRLGEVKDIDNRRGRERGLVEENEHMSIEDMVREERRTRGQAGGEGQRFAERIAKDGKFDVGQYFALSLLC